MIIGEIRRYLRDNSPLRVSRSLKDIAYKAMQLRESFYLENQREPTAEEIGKIISKPVDMVALALDSVVSPISLNEPVFNNGENTVYVMDQIQSAESDEDWISEIALREIEDELDEREKLILKKRFLGGKTQMEVAREIGISQAQVSRLEKGAIDKIKEVI